MTVAAAVFFDARSADPTGTAGLRRSFRAAGKMRMNMFRSAMRQAVVEHDVLGLGGAGLAMQPPETRLQAFNGWARVAAGRALDGPWLSEWIARAWASGEAAGALQARTQAPGVGSGAWAELAKVELDAIAFAVVQVITREAAIALTKRRANKVMVWRRMAKAFDKVGPKRIMALANTFCVSCHNRGRLASYRAAKINMVGVIPEKLLPKQALLLPGGLGDRLTHDDVHKGYSKRAAARPEYELGEVEGPIQVGVRTAGDEFVCQACDEFAAGSPYDIEEVEDTLPMHVSCRCTWFPWEDKRYSRDAWDPNQPRDPDGKWGEGGGSGEWTKGSPLKGTRVFWRGTNPGDTRRISTGTEFDKHLFVSADPDSAKMYGSSLARYEAHPDAKILYEGTSEWKKVAGRPRRNESLLDYAVRASNAAQAAGYDAAAFERQGDVGTAIFNPDKFTVGVKDEFDPSQARDPDGKWTGAGGPSAGGDGHPGKGYSASAKLIKGVIHTSSVYDAQRALFENRKVELQHLKQVSTLIDKLGETAAKMEAAGEKAVVFNLCNVSITGTNLFCAESKGIPRVEMPVIRAKKTKEFVKYLKSRGYKTEKSVERADHLRSTQDQIDGAKVAANMKRIDKEGFYKRIIVSRDDYILDGHHTWAGQLGVDARDGSLKGDKTVRITRVDISITKLLAEAETWTGGAGKKAAGQDAWNPLQPREPAGVPEGGQFASISGGGISGGATGGPVGAKKPVWKPSANVDVHRTRVEGILNKPALRNSRFRYQVGKLMEEAKTHGTTYAKGVGAISAHDALDAMKQKIGESFWQQAALKMQKAGGQTAETKKMIQQANVHGYYPPVEQANAIASLLSQTGSVTVKAKAIDPLLSGETAQKQSMANVQAAAATEASAPPPPAQEIFEPMLGPEPAPVQASKATTAELEKAKKVGPYYPAPTSEIGKSVVKYFNEKWGTTAPKPEQLEEKVADYKNAKAALEAIQKEEDAAQEKQHQAAKAEQAAAKAAAKAKEEAESVKHQAVIEEIAAELGLSPSDADQVDTLISLAGGNKASIVSKFKEFQKSGIGKHGLPLTPFQSAMIQSYVGSAYGHANRQLREGVWDMKTHVFAAAIQKSLTKLPGYNDTLQRGFTANKTDQDKYEVGKIVHWNAFSSCGKKSSFSGNMQCTITPLSDDRTRARDLGPMNPNEAGGEVLYMAHSSFKVTSVKGSPGGTMHVHLQEVETF